MADLNELKGLIEKLKGNTDLKSSVKVLVHFVADHLATLTQDPVAIGRAAAELRASADDVTEAVVAGTEPTTTESVGPEATKHKTEHKAPEHKEAAHKTGGHTAHGGHGHKK